MEILRSLEIDGLGIEQGAPLVSHVREEAARRVGRFASHGKRERALDAVIRETVEAHDNVLGTQVSS